MVEIEEAIKLCDSKSNKETIIACKFNLLHKITEKQDIVNLDLIKTLDDDTDERWVPLHMVNNANAIILGVSRNKVGLSRYSMNCMSKKRLDILMICGTG